MRSRFLAPVDFSIFFSDTSETVDLPDLQRVVVPFPTPFCLLESIMLKAISIAVAMCFVTSIACSGQTPSPIQDPQAVNILSQCNTAMGTPASALSLLLTGSIIDTDHQAEARQLSIKIRGAYYERAVQQYSQETVAHVYSGKRAWIEKRGKRTPLSESETAIRMPEFVPAFACVNRRERSLMDLQYVGRETIGGTAIDHLRIGFLHSKPASFDQAVDMAIAQLDLYIDAESHLVFAVKRESFSAADYGTHHTMETRYAAYNSAFGLQIPMQTTHLLNGTSIEKTTITNVAQETFSDADFK